MFLRLVDSELVEYVRRRGTISRNDPERRDVGINWSRTRNTVDVRRFLEGVFSPQDDEGDEDDDDDDVPVAAPFPRSAQKRPTGI